MTGDIVPFRSSKTTRMPSLSDSSRMSEIPSIRFSFTISAIPVIHWALFTWYGSSVTMIRSPRFPPSFSSISATPRTTTRPWPVV